MTFPPLLLPYKKSAEEIFRKGRVTELEFSGSTYQIKVIDDQYPEGAWTFLQFGLRQHLSDCLCSCDAFDEDKGCVHLAAACLKIYHGKSQPLHVRFQESFWNQLCHLFFESWAGNSQKFSLSEKEYRISLQSDQYKMVLIPKSMEADLEIAKFLDPDKEETEETSIKFSNLTEEEIALWRKGRPSASLQYELSIWSGLAKWLMQKQEEGLSYKIEFSGDGLPTNLSVVFSEFEIKIAFQEGDWSKLIPSLTTVDSNLVLHRTDQDSTKRISFDEEKRCLHIESKKEEEVVFPNSIELGNWWFVPSVGFYPKTPKNLLLPHLIPTKDIGFFLSKHGSFVQSQLKNIKLHEQPALLNYSFVFDSDWNLEITAYLFEPGDIYDLFGDWAYIKEVGFYFIERKIFDSISEKIFCANINHFVQQHRAWLNGQEGYKTHITQLETSLTYQVNNQGGIEIHHALEEGAEGGRHYKNFGDWIYIAGEGFYETKSPFIRTNLYAGMSIESSEVAIFIKKSEEELKFLPQFFSETSPIKRFALRVEYMNDGSVLVMPAYEFSDEVNESRLLFYKDFVYQPEKGFSKIPIDPNIPQKYHLQTTVPHYELTQFIEEELDGLRPYCLSISDELKRPRKVRPYVKALSRVKNSASFFALELVYRTDFGEIDATVLWAKLKNKESYFLSEAGLISLKGYRYEWLKQVTKQQIDPIKGEFVVCPWDLIKLHLLENPFPPKDEKSLKIFREMTDEPKLITPSIEGLKAVLRPYQVTGLQWLWHLKQHHFNGLLSDDMGLGKTLQALSLIVAMVNASKIRQKILILCPTSVLYHWLEKINQFYPQLKVLIYWGQGRKLKNFTEDCNVLLSSYGTYRSDSQKLGKLTFDLAVFDEVQVAKNHTSLLYQALKHVQATMRLGLTGTPIENTVRELKAIFDLILPGYMPREEVFRDIYLKPIEKEGDQLKKEQLKVLAAPFILRRKKEDVLDDLPEKIEEVYHCNLSSEQHSLYQDLLVRERSALFEGFSLGSKNYLHVFALLSKLKQVCNHPACFFKKPEDWQNHTSGKFDLFKEILEEALGSNQKVVVFSQYLNMLDIFELYLNSHRISFASIRGRTANRQQEISRFQTDPNCVVFLGSLHAAGLGIDLTSASVVIHYDRWWNAAKENQATDRVHRIGQSKGVQVFKFVTINTLEEQIDKLISKKRFLLEEIVGQDDSALVKTLSKEELFCLLSDIPGSN